MNGKKLLDADLARWQEKSHRLLNTVMTYDHYHFTPTEALMGRHRLIDQIQWAKPEENDE